MIQIKIIDAQFEAIIKRGRLELVEKCVENSPLKTVFEIPTDTDPMDYLNSLAKQNYFWELRFENEPEELITKWAQADFLHDLRS
jgi:hypothetical protein